MIDTRAAPPRSDFHPLAAAIQRDPYPHYRRLRDEQPVAWLPSLGWHLVTRYADVEQVLRSPQQFSSSIMRSADKTLLGRDPPAHTSVRRRISPAFTAAAVKKMQPWMAQTVRPIACRLAHHGGGDFVEGFANPVAGAAIARVLAIDATRWHDFRAWSDAVILGASGTVKPSERAEVDRRVGEFDHYIGELVQRRRSHPEDDLISTLLTCDEHEPLDDGEVRSLVRLLVIAGTGTTTHLMSNALMAMLTTPGLQELLRRDPAQRADWVEETLRFDTPVQIVLRRTRDPIELEGSLLPCESVVAAAIGSANRDERRFDMPDDFRLGRDRSHAAFGAGPHTCLGAAFARLVAEAGLGALIEESRHLSATGSLQGIERLASLQLRGPRRLDIAMS